MKNKTIVVNKLNELIEKHLIPDIPRVATRPTKESKEKRLLEKKQSGSIKSMRGNLKNKELWYLITLFLLQILYKLN